MRIIDIYNCIATAACVLMGAAAFVIGKKRERGILDGGRGFDGDGAGVGSGGCAGGLSSKATYIALAVIIAVAAFLRLFLLGRVPLGLAPDEASIGYDAYAIAKFSIDRNGYAYPVYPITWGPGGGSPLLIYLNVLSIKLFGTGIVKLRMIPAICGILTIPVFFGILKEISGKRAFSNEISLFGAAFLAICPWHVILSRWTLDSNIMPFTLGLAVYLFMLAIRKRSTLLYCLSAAMYAVCMYSYGSATIVVPLHLLLICIICLRKKVLSVKQLIASGVTFMVIFAPLFVFYAVNYLGLPEIITEHFSVNKFTASRTGEVFLTPGPGFFGQLFDNAKTLLVALTISDKHEMFCHFYPGYWMLYVFTFPIVFIGIAIGVKELCAKARDDAASGGDGADAAAASGGDAGYASDADALYSMNAVWSTLLIACFVMAIAIKADASRMVMMYLPLIFYFVKGAEFVLVNSKKLFYALCVIVLLAAISFAKDYFTDFSDKAADVFMPGYGDAMVRAYEIAGDDRTVYSTYDGLSSPFMLALYYTNYSPVDFHNTVVYKDPDAEFRVAESYGNFVFGLPDDALAGSVIADKYSDDVFVLSKAECSELSDFGGYVTEEIGGYMILYK
ncbi:hypothetical protein D6856_12680 [Butyrivibrio sp. XB500-5]|uniref:ArnT family glycosyltransferase n=1 Tax=Butyrivibrio sp. XB500-5 TaxID=2364880 RepID=UPI000EAA9B99|nr:glycosyltransferase family 39 protein [Butyrivibrio sp. XB500-5]RKM58602.1 hypothetical protein D6856_12680 [Butyrivibrio sp. XB500-5]